MLTEFFTMFYFDTGS